MALGYPLGFSTAALVVVGLCTSNQSRSGSHQLINGSI